MPEITHRKKRLSSFKLIVLGFAGVILLGALILMLPFSSTAGVVTPFHEIVFMIFRKEKLRLTALM